MGWRNLSYWLRGGLIGLLIGLIIWIVWFVWGTLDVQSGGSENELIVLGSMIVFIGGLILLAIGFIIGTIVGLIVGKSKYKINKH